MGSTGKLRLIVKERRTFTPVDQSLLDILHSKANWVWSLEDPTWRPPFAPEGEQRAFRKTFTYSSDKGRPTKAKFIVAADNYFAFYVDGVMVQPADGTHDWTAIDVFEMPLPVIQNRTSSSMLLGFRVYNRDGWVGLLVAAQIDYESGDPDILYTGLDDTWQGERTFDEGWEQPWFKSDSWPRANIFSQSVRSPAEPLLKQGEVAVFESLPASMAPGACDATRSTSIGLSVGAFAGVLVGAILAALAVGAAGAYFLLRRRYRALDSWSDDGGVALQTPALISEPFPGSEQPPTTSFTFGESGPVATSSSRPTAYLSSNSTVPETYTSTDAAPPTYSETPQATSARIHTKSRAR
ncbi:hypothetical protein NMY22_g18669 [Coprinellus aureogranulatus]|nr:hypothetical protein NMY22_g18669 [Coprinellus aureogranulatus]